MGTEGILSKHNVLAAFGDTDPARRAIEQLETAGVDAASISLSPEHEVASDSEGHPVDAE